MAEVSNSKLLQIDTGIPDANACIVIVRTEWNAAIVDELERGCRSTLASQSIKNIRVLTVPGAFEIAFAIKRYWDLNKYKDHRPFAFIALGCVLRGGTPHFEYVCKGVTDGIVQLNLLLPVPTIFGILTVDTQEQASERIGGAHGHKGEEAAITALKMIALQNSFNK
ncbi:MAG: 6,7-dimethyl-8-ribityllumazine synthase [Chitinophagaceae bacterium]|nr:6,7-dimethyl-8-ribityllumazine synthase [Chitinophagaceae bacterium]